MLLNLTITNFAIIDRLEVQFDEGFNVLTGETGAGKSLLIGALQLLLGERADKSLIRAGAESCTVEAVFEMADSRELDAWLEEQGAEPCGEGELLLKRTLSAAARACRAKGVCTP